MALLMIIVICIVCFNDSSFSKSTGLLFHENAHCVTYVYKGASKGVDKTHLVWTPPPQLLLQGLHGLNTQSTRNWKIW